MPTARKLPSGSYRCRVFSHYVMRDGKKRPVYESFTAPTKREAEANAASDESYDDGTEDEAEGEYGFLDPDGYVPEEEDDGVVDGNGNVDYGDGQQDVYTDDEYDYSYDNNDGYVDDGI